MRKKIIAASIALVLVFSLIWRMTRVNYMTNPNKENKNILFVAERSASPYCRLEIKATGKMEIMTGNNSGTHLVSGNYILSGDTLIFKNDILGISDFIHTNKFLLDGDKLLININEKGAYDTISCLKIRKNKIKS
ncbi:MAG: hypothetical protein JNL60_07450 [Bacteroidia bacterium]|nr:hypothetical protein [Bacteroidia bacterium]